MHTLLNTSFMIVIFIAGCKDNSVNPFLPPTPPENKWEEIVMFHNTDIRYMIQHNGVLYVSTYTSIPVKDSTAFVLYKTEDGIKWDTLKTFERCIGPIDFDGDTLTILESGRTWKYHTTFGWKMFWEHLIVSDHTFDMFWLHNRLFVFDNAFGLVYSLDTVKWIRDLMIEPSVSRFIKHVYQGKEVVYTRPYFVYEDKIYRFDGSSFEKVMNGIAYNENTKPNYPAMVVNRDTLYAGFNTPSRIKKLVNDAWVNITDTIPNTPYANRFSPTLINRPSSIMFYQNRMFVGTEWTGVMEWTDSGWVSIAKGLNLAFPNYPQYELYRSIPFLESFNGKLFAAYGQPFFGTEAGGTGIYIFNLGR